MEHSEEFFRLMEPQIRFWGKNFSQIMQYRQSLLWRTELFTDVEISLSQTGWKANTMRTSQNNPLFLIAPSLCTKSLVVQKHHMPSLGVSCWSGMGWSQEMRAPKIFREGDIGKFENHFSCACPLNLMSLCHVLSCPLPFPEPRFWH